MLGKVLIIDDIATNRIVLNVKLSAAGYRVLQASTGEEGLALAFKEAPDIAVIPATLPDVKAKELIAALRTQPPLMSVPVIVLCEAHDLGNRLDLLEAGASDILMRPPDSGALLARFRSLLRTKESEEEAALNEHMRRSLGFQEPATEFETPWQIQLVGDTAPETAAWAGALGDMRNCQFSARPISDILHGFEAKLPQPDVIVLKLSEEKADARLEVLSDLRASPNLRHAGIIAVLDAPDAKLYARALDRGADEILPFGFSTPELKLRIAQLAQRKRTSDRSRAHMQAGLSAAITDPLTSLFNRRFALPHLARTLQESRCAGIGSAVMALDIDHFKRINDRYGHQAGDKTLIELADLMRSSLRKDEVIARMGGEEFLIILENTSRAEAEAIARRLCMRVSEHSFPIPGSNRALRLTVSIGVAFAAPEDKAVSVEQMLERADAALYGSKRHGRNQVTLSKRSAA